MAERLFGVETEYAFNALGRGGVPLPREALLGRFMDLARMRLPHLRDQMSGGFFMGNGGRFYVDCGTHPEVTTPECANPWDIVRYTQAGEQMLALLAAELAARDPEVAEVTLFKCNVDYGGTGATWGCHESYLHTTDPRIIPDQILPHLASRLIYAGAGGFNSLSPQHEFVLSPRVAHLVKVVSDASTHDRGIFHTKNESLCAGGYGRLHILCGESLCSQTAQWLKTGSTVLVVAMIEAGLRPGDDVAVSPLDAMRCFAADETCSVAVKGLRGRRLTAIDIQRHYLNLAQTHVHEPFMPPWAGEVVKLWQAILDRLEHGAPESVSTVLDWAIKLSIYRNRLRPHAITCAGSKAAPNGSRELFEIDTRFGQLGERGIFSALDRAGVLDHQVPGVDNIEHAIENPPAIGRALVRGQSVRKFAGHTGRYTADWQAVWDIQENRFIDLSNPFETQEQWRSKSEPMPGPGTLERYLELITSSQSPPGSPSIPQEFRMGDRVILAPPEGAFCFPDRTPGEDRHRETNRYVGQAGTILRLAPSRSGGRALVRMDSDGSRWVWPIRNLLPVPEQASTPF